MSYELEWFESDVIVSFTGDTDFDEIIEASNFIIGSPKFDNMAYAIYNYSGIDKFNLVNDDIIVLAALNKKASLWNPRIRLAFVGKEEYLYNMLKYYISLMDDVEWNIRVFEDLEKSLKWCKQ